jgi:flavin reductase (DIM6/NTAB) family NADH-FMN oxidoreductase RutF
MADFDAHRFRRALGQFPTGVIIATARSAEGERVGITMNSFSSVSLDPPLILFSISRRANSFPVWQAVARYAINVLNEDQEELSNRFARAKEDKWDGLDPLTSASGVPILPNAVVALECEAYGRHDGGDHEIFVGRVVAIHEHGVHRGRPLVFFEGRYRRLASAAAHRVPEEAVFLHGW